ncbi:helix-turn-helix domain-containing protein [Streptomyces sp. NPDC051172]|uniref:helix-turn-helix domain-containing protein n=1 Tax=Streptomyces sp. NPDC051172 TaxID=3155796 RepID=UPI0034313427
MSSSVGGSRSVRPKASRWPRPAASTCRPPKLSDLDVEQARVMIQMGIPKAEVARTFGVSRQTLYTSLRRQASD